MLIHRVRREPARIATSYGAWAALLCLARVLGPSRWTALLGGSVGAFYGVAALRAAWALRGAAGAADGITALRCSPARSR
jgi:hypothetical protein